MRPIFSLFLLVGLLVTGSVQGQPTDAKVPKQLSAVRVNVTNQPWDFLRPWGKRAPYSRRAVGAVLAGGRVLVTAELVANATFVEFEAPDGGGKAAATRWSITKPTWRCSKRMTRTFSKPTPPWS
jgi:hypothetical protein